MKKFLMATVAVIAFAAAASAADMAPQTYTKAPAYVAPVYNWTGLYVGIEGGYGWAQERWANPFSGDPFDNAPNVSGGMVGGVVGYNWQFSSNWVLGVEGSFDWADLNKTTLCATSILVCGSKIDAVYTATGRLGYVWGSLLVYGKGGAAWAEDHASLAAAASPGSLSTGLIQRDGWTAGGGLEWMFAKDWSAKVEYSYYDFGTKREFLFGPNSAGNSLTKIEMSSVKAGINYHFDLGKAPGVAKY